MVEARAQSTEYVLIEGLSYKLGAGASYVTNRRSVSFFPSGSDAYSPSSGVKVIKIKMNGTDWLDPSTVKVQFDNTWNRILNFFEWRTCCFWTYESSMWFSGGRRYLYDHPTGDKEVAGRGLGATMHHFKNGGYL